MIVDMNGADIEAEVVGTNTAYTLKGCTVSLSRQELVRLLTKDETGSGLTFTISSSEEDREEN